jgi:hypothetical protein
MPNPLDGLLGALRPRTLTPEEQAQQDAQAEQAQGKDPAWKRMARSAFEGGSDALMGLLGAGEDTQANRVGQLAGAALPVKSLLHGWDDIERIAKGASKVRLYHGTTAENAEQILKRGVQLPESGEVAARKVAELYKIPWTEWANRVEPQQLGSGYGTATQRLSTAPYPIAHRWSKHFPQGEIYSDLNSKARLYAEAKRRGIPYDDFYNQAGEIADQKGMRNIYHYPDAVGAEDLMKPSGRPGVVLGVDVDARAINPGQRREAEIFLKNRDELTPIANPTRFDETPERLLKQWNTMYQDIKIHPQNIQNIERAQSVDPLMSAGPAVKGLRVGGDPVQEALKAERHKAYVQRMFQP